MRSLSELELHIGVVGKHLGGRENFYSLSSQFSSRVDLYFHLVS